jgi:hypothetical protein
LPNRKYREHQVFSWNVSMKRLRVHCFLLSILLSPLAWGGSLVIQRVTVIDSTGKPAQPGITVVIAEVGS